jgi:cob(I)alamin adenosyltransferase
MITTKTGDDGKSRWLNKVVDKDDLLLEAVGTIDELMVILNLDFRSSTRLPDGQVIDRRLLGDLMNISGELACDIKFDDLEKRIIFLEEEMEILKKEMPEIKGFLTFENKESTLLNLARTVCRRAERRVVSLYKRDKINKSILVYLNRLSDYLFILSVIKN